MKKFFILIFLFVQSTFASNIKELINQTVSVPPLKDKHLYPHVYFDMKAEVFYNKLSSSNAEIDGQSLLYTKSDLTLDLNTNEYFTIHTQFGLEKIKGFGFAPAAFNVNKKKESIFYGTSLTAKELTARFNFDRVKFDIGKFGPIFGAGSDRGNDFFYENWYGISGTEINEGYALEEKIGAKLNVSIIERNDTKVNFELSAFTNDNSTLYNKPFFVEREIENFTVPLVNKRLAGSANGLKSHSASLQGFYGFADRSILSLGLGYRGQFSSENNVFESGAVLSGGYTKIFFDDLVISSFAEWAKITNAYGLKNFDERYLTGSFSAGFAGVKLGILRNYYRGELGTLALNEIFLGFEVPKTELGFFISRKEYSVQKLSGFAMNIRYRIR
jgi:hypothetical protein